MRTKIIINDYLDWRKKFYENKSDLRLGQAFLNEFYPDHASSTLYYETQYKEAEKMIMEDYVAYSERDLNVIRLVESFKK